MEGNECPIPDHGVEPVFALCEHIHKDNYKSLIYKNYWRTERDSNPRYAFTYTRFPGVHLQPLGHLSVKF